MLLHHATRRAPDPPGAANPHSGDSNMLLARRPAAVLAFTHSAPALAQVTIRAHGPGGPAPAMEEAAARFKEWGWMAP
jgi:hypothetical protein